MNLSNNIERRMVTVEENQQTLLEQNKRILACVQIRNSHNNKPRNNRQASSSNRRPNMHDVSKLLHYREALKRNIHEFTERIELNSSDLLDDLLANDCITDNDNETICMKATNKERVRLLIALLKDRDPAIIRNFIEILHNHDYQDLVERVNASLEEIKRENSDKISCVVCVMTAAVDVRDVVDDLWRANVVGEDLFCHIAAVDTVHTNRQKLWAMIIESINESDCKETARSVLKNALKLKYKFIVDHLDKIYTGQPFACCCCKRRKLRSRPSGLHGSISDLSTTSTRTIEGSHGSFGSNESQFDDSDARSEASGTTLADEPHNTQSHNQLVSTMAARNQQEMRQGRENPHLPRVSNLTSRVRSQNQVGINISTQTSAWVENHAPYMSPRTNAPADIVWLNLPSSNRSAQGRNSLHLSTNKLTLTENQRHFSMPTRPRVNIGNKLTTNVSRERNNSNLQNTIGAKYEENKPIRQSGRGKVEPRNLRNDNSMSNLNFLPTHDNEIKHDEDDTSSKQGGIPNTSNCKKNSVDNSCVGNEYVEATGTLSSMNCHVLERVPGLHQITEVEKQQVSSFNPDIYGKHLALCESASSSTNTNTIINNTEGQDLHQGLEETSNTTSDMSEKGTSTPPTCQNDLIEPSTNSLVVMASSEETTITNTQHYHPQNSGDQSPKHQKQPKQCDTNCQDENTPKTPTLDVDKRGENHDKHSSSLRNETFPDVDISVSPTPEVNNKTTDIPDRTTSSSTDKASLQQVVMQEEKRKVVLYTRNKGHFHSKRSSFPGLPVDRRRFANRRYIDRRTSTRRIPKKCKLPLIENSQVNDTHGNKSENCVHASKPPENISGAKFNTCSKEDINSYVATNNPETDVIDGTHGNNRERIQDIDEDRSVLENAKEDNNSYAAANNPETDVGDGTNENNREHKQDMDEDRSLLENAKEDNNSYAAANSPGTDVGDGTHENNKEHIQDIDEDRSVLENAKEDNSSYAAANNPDTDVGNGTNETKRDHKQDIGADICSSENAIVASSYDKDDHNIKGENSFKESGLEMTSLLAIHVELQTKAAQIPEHTNPIMSDKESLKVKGKCQQLQIESTPLDDDPENASSVNTPGENSIQENDNIKCSERETLCLINKNKRGAPNLGKTPLTSKTTNNDNYTQESTETVTSTDTLKGDTVPSSSFDKTVPLPEIEVRIPCGKYPYEDKKQQKVSTEHANMKEASPPVFCPDVLIFGEHYDNQCVDGDCKSHHCTIIRKVDDANMNSSLDIEQEKTNTSGKAKAIQANDRKPQNMHQDVSKQDIPSTELTTEAIDLVTTNDIDARTINQNNGTVPEKDMLEIEYTVTISAELNGEVSVDQLVDGNETVTKHKIGASLNEDTSGTPNNIINEMNVTDEMCHREYIPTENYESFEALADSGDNQEFTLKYKTQEQLTNLFDKKETTFVEDDNCTNYLRSKCENSLTNKCDTTDVLKSTNAKKNRNLNSRRRRKLKQKLDEQHTNFNHAGIQTLTVTKNKTENVVLDSLEGTVNVNDSFSNDSLECSNRRVSTDGDSVNIKEETFHKFDGTEDDIENVDTCLSTAMENFVGDKSGSGCSQAGDIDGIKVDISCSTGLDKLESATMESNYKKVSVSSYLPDTDEITAIEDTDIIEPESNHSLDDENMEGIVKENKARVETETGTRVGKNEDTPTENIDLVENGSCSSSSATRSTKSVDIVMETQSGNTKIADTATETMYKLETKSNCSLAVDSNHLEHTVIESNAEVENQASCSLNVDNFNATVVESKDIVETGSICSSSFVEVDDTNNQGENGESKSHHCTTIWKVDDAKVYSSFAIDHEKTNTTGETIQANDGSRQNVHQDVSEQDIPSTELTNEAIDLVKPNDIDVGTINENNGMVPEKDMLEIEHTETTSAELNGKVSVFQIMGGNDTIIKHKIEVSLNEDTSGTPNKSINEMTVTAEMCRRKYIPTENYESLETLADSSDNHKLTLKNKTQEQLTDLSDKKETTFMEGDNCTKCVRSKCDNSLTNKCYTNDVLKSTTAKKNRNLNSRRRRKLKQKLDEQHANSSHAGEQNMKVTEDKTENVVLDSLEGTVNEKNSFSNDSIECSNRRVSTDGDTVNIKEETFHKFDGTEDDIENVDTCLSTAEESYVGDKSGSGCSQAGDIDGIKVDISCSTGLDKLESATMESNYKKVSVSSYSPETDEHEITAIEGTDIIEPESNHSLDDENMEGIVKENKTKLETETGTSIGKMENTPIEKNDLVENRPSSSSSATTKCVDIVMETKSRDTKIADIATETIFNLETKANCSLTVDINKLEHTVIEINGGVEKQTSCSLNGDNFEAIAVESKDMVVTGLICSSSVVEVDDTNGECNDRVETTSCSLENMLSTSLKGKSENEDTCTSYVTCDENVERRVTLATVYSGDAGTCLPNLNEMYIITVSRPLFGRDVLPPKIGVRNIVSRSSKITKSRAFRRDKAKHRH